MELIHIIYNILLFGGVFLLVVVIISYSLSKSRQSEIKNHQIINNSIPERIVKARTNFQHQMAPVTQSSKLQWEQNYLRKKTLQVTPKIFTIEHHQPREIKVVRKPTVREEQETKVTEERIFNGKRYTIVNENQKKSNSRVINFYL